MVVRGTKEEKGGSEKESNGFRKVKEGTGHRASLGSALLRGGTSQEGVRIEGEAKEGWKMMHFLGKGKRGFSSSLPCPGGANDAG
jgi:hypothetical protein